MNLLKCKLQAKIAMAEILTSPTSELRKKNLYSLRVSLFSLIINNYNNRINSGTNLQNENLLCTEIIEIAALKNFIEQTPKLGNI